MNISVCSVMLQYILVALEPDKFGCFLAARVIKGKGSVVRDHAMMACRGSGGIVALTLNFGTRWR